MYKLMILFKKNEDISWLSDILVISQLVEKYHHHQLFPFIQTPVFSQTITLFVSLCYSVEWMLTFNNSLDYSLDYVLTHTRKVPRKDEEDIHVEIHLYHTYISISIIHGLGWLMVGFGFDSIGLEKLTHTDLLNWGNHPKMVI